MAKEPKEIKYLLLKACSPSAMFTSQWYLGEWLESKDTKDSYVLKWPIRIVEFVQTVNGPGGPQSGMVLQYVADQLLTPLDEALFSKAAGVFEIAGLLDANDVTQRGHITERDKAIEGLRMRKAGLVPANQGGKIQGIKHPTANQ